MTAPRHGLALWPRRVVALPVRAYRFFLKPWLGNACRFEPSCSAYALQALDRHGACAGSLLAGARLLRCHPWCQGGLDPVPDKLFTPLLRRASAHEPRQINESS